jgi:hypothetical protein
MEPNGSSKPVKKFVRIEVPPDLTKANFLFLYFNTLIIGMLMVVPAILQPAFLKDVIRVSPDFFGYINGFLQNMSQFATLATDVSPKAQLERSWGASTPCSPSVLYSFSRWEVCFMTSWDRAGPSGSRAQPTWCWLPGFSPSEKKSAGKWKTGRNS